MILEPALKTADEVSEPVNPLANCELFGLEQVGGTTTPDRARLVIAIDVTHAVPQPSIGAWYEASAQPGDRSLIEGIDPERAAQQYGFRRQEALESWEDVGVYSKQCQLIGKWLLALDDIQQSKEYGQLAESAAIGVAQGVHAQAIEVRKERTDIFVQRMLAALANDENVTIFSTIGSAHLEDELEAKLRANGVAYAIVRQSVVRPATADETRRYYDRFRFVGRVA